MDKDAYLLRRKAFCELLREIRREKRLTQADVANGLQVPQSFVSKVETGERRLDFVETAVYCAALGLDIVELARLFTQRPKGGSRKGP